MAQANYTVKIARFTVLRETPPDRWPALSDPYAVAQIAGSVIPDDGREHFGVLMLSSQNRLVAYHEVSVGTLTATLVHPREVFGPALRIMGVAAVVLVHNHPSGDLKPSREDERLTRQLVSAGELLDIKVHDHVIIGSGNANYASMSEAGLL